MDTAIQVSDGERPYIFISYAHANAPAVMEVLGVLAERGYRIWYDSGIEVGSEWQEDIAGHLASAGLMIAFISNAYVRSDNCRKEMHFALTKKIPVISVFLENTRLTPGLEMQMGNLFALMKHELGEERFYERLLTAPQLTDELREGGAPTGAHARGGARRAGKRRPVPVDVTAEEARRKKRRVRRFIRLGTALVLLIALAVLGIVGWSTGLLPRLLIRREQVELVPLPGETVIPWSDGTAERAAREYCGAAEGDITVADLTGLTELRLSGAGTGTLADLRYFPDLSVLILEDGELPTLETLAPCGVETLTLVRCGTTSLRGIANLPLLRELEVVDCPLREITDLDRCLQLRRLAVPGESVRSFSAVKPLVRLTEVAVSGAALERLRPIFRLSSLSDVALYDCDLRGRFFYAFDRESAIVSLRLEHCELSGTRNLDDFTGLTTLTLVGSGANLDWSALAALPVLRTVYADAAMEPALTAALADGGAALLPADAA